MPQFSNGRRLYYASCHLQLHSPRTRPRVLGKEEPRESIGVHEKISIQADLVLTSERAGQSEKQMLTSGEGGGVITCPVGTIHTFSLYSSVATSYNLKEKTSN